MIQIEDRVLRNSKALSICHDLGMTFYPGPPKLTTFYKQDEQRLYKPKNKKDIHHFKTSSCDRGKKVAKN